MSHAPLAAVSVQKAGNMGAYGPMDDAKKVDRPGNRMKTERRTRDSPAKLLALPSNRPVSLADFHYIKSCGTGTFGEVAVYEYRSDPLGMKTKVAIKKVFQNPDYKNREFLIHAKLNHRNIVRVLLPAGVTSPSPKQPSGFYLHLVMECFDKSIFNVVQWSRRSGQQLRHDVIQSYLRQILEGTHYMARRQIAHRDLKPENVLVQFDRKSSSSTSIEDRIALCDFGNAKVLSGEEESISYICTRVYRAPELVYGASKYGPAVDIWSIGCIAVELAIGHPLFGLSFPHWRNIQTVAAPPSGDEGRTEKDSDGLRDDPSMIHPRSPMLWENIARCLGFPQESEIIDMRCSYDVAKKYHNQARRAKDHSLLKGFGLKNWLTSMHEYAQAAYLSRPRNPDYPENPFPSFEICFPNPFIDFLSHLLRYSPTRRLSADQALKHRYFRTKFTNNKEGI